MTETIKRTPLQQKAVELSRYYLELAEYHRDLINKTKTEAPVNPNTAGALDKHYTKEAVYLQCAQDLQDLLREKCTLCEQMIKHEH